MLRKCFKQISQEPMECDEIIVKLQGGLGNQLFQLAYALDLASKTSSPIRFSMQRGPFPFALEVLGLNNNKSFRFSNEIFFEVKQTSHSYRCDFHVYKHYSSKFLPLKNPPGHLVLDGYFQSEKYFQSIAEPLKNALLSKFNIDLDIENQHRFVAHVRLGDYVKKRKISAIHGHISEAYLTKALEILKWKEEDLLCVVTDDKSSFQSLFPRYNTPLVKIQSLSQIEDFRTIATAKNKIISNSTFSWWAAWLGKGDVVAPKRWYAEQKILDEARNDLFPKKWILL